MRKGFNSKIVDLTPLLDVVLILLFALLLNLSAANDKVQAEADQLENQLEMNEADFEKQLGETVTEYDEQLLEANEDINKLIQENNELSEENKRIEANYEVYDDQYKELEEALSRWLASEEVVKTSEMESEEIMALFEEYKTNKTLYQLDYIADKFFFIDIVIDSDKYHEVYLNGSETGVHLGLNLEEDKDLKEKASVEIFDLIEEELGKKEGGYRFVLFTLTYDERVYETSYDLVWTVIKEIETKHDEETIYKLGYLEYN